MKSLGIILKVLAALIAFGLIALGFYFYSAKKSAENKSRMIDELAKIPPGSRVDEVMSRAKELGFQAGKSEFAIPNVVEMINEDLSQKQNALPVKVDNDTNLSQLKNGKLIFSLSLFLFSRKGCEFTFKDGVVNNVRIWTLD